MARVFPALQELDHLPTPLNIGERQVLDGLLHLDDDWLIYVQPRLGMDQPDFVVLNPRFGVTVIEVKDWSLDMYRQRSDGRIEVRHNESWRLTGEAPLFQVHRYRDTIFNRFFADPNDPKSDFKLVRGVVVMARHTTQEARELLKSPNRSEQWISVFGGEAVYSDTLTVVTGARQMRTRAVPEHCIGRLRRYLAEPEFVADRRLPLNLCSAAQNIDRNPSSAKMRRVRGAAGSGKSLGLATRAARLAGEGKEVLVVTFNGTLTPYLHDLAARRCHELQADIRRITFTSFHGLCSHVATAAEVVGADLPTITNEERFEFQVDRALAAYELGFGPQFDAVLVDEGQDFSLRWWNLLRAFVVRPDGEMLLVADPTQDLYEKQAWTDEAKMLGAGFSGQWTEARGSYRMPPDLIPIAASFAARHLVDAMAPTVPFDHPQAGMLYQPTVRRWVNLAEGEPLGYHLGTEVVELLNDNPDLAPSDVVFLAQSHIEGLQAVRVIAAAGHEVQHLFALDKHEQRRRKERFLPTSPGVKGCTVHSFKGWESRAVVLTLNARRDSRRLAYVGLTRVKGDPAYRAAYVTVINADKSLRDFVAEFMAGMPSAGDRQPA